MSCLDSRIEPKSIPLIAPKDESNDRLIGRLEGIVRRDRVCEARLVEVLGEVDARRLYLGRACSSMFEYCVRVLHFAEGVAFKRIAVARAGRRHAEILSALASGEIHLTGACLIAPHLNGDADEWIALARHATAREIKRRIADRKPKMGVETFVRRLPTRRSRNHAGLLGSDEVRSAVRQTSVMATNVPADSTSNRGIGTTGCYAAGEHARPDDSSASSRTAEEVTELPRSVDASARTGPGIASASASDSETTLFERLQLRPERDRARVEALGAERYAIRIVVDEQVHGQLEELRALLRHSFPDGDVAKILARSIGELLERVRKRKFGRASGVSAGARPRPRAKTTSGSKRKSAAANSRKSAAPTLAPARPRQTSPTLATAPPAPTALPTTPTAPTKRNASALPTARDRPAPPCATWEASWPEQSTRAVDAPPTGKLSTPSTRAEPARPDLSASRHIPMAIRRTVWARDHGCCAYVSADGDSCAARKFLEFHHRVPWAHNAEHSTENIGLRCRAHNQFEAEYDFGREKMARYRR